MSRSGDIIFSSFKTRLLRFIEKDPLRFTYYLFLIIGSFLRIVAALRADGVLHPDEIYQSFEMAHLIIYGSGYTAPEFRTENELIPSYAASRSWLFPLLFAALMKIGEFLSLDYHTQILPMIRIFLGLNSILLIPAVRTFTKELTEDETTATIASVLIAIWYKIIEFTVRAFSNTFFLPLLLFGMARALHIVKFNKTLRIRDHLILMVSLGLPTYIRFDLGILVFVVFIATFNIKTLNTYGLMIIDGICAWILGVIYDFSHYHIWFSVPINWFKFNVIEHNSDIFGTATMWFFTKHLLIRGGLWVWFLPTSVIMIAGYNQFKRRDKFGKMDFWSMNLLLILLLSIVAGPMEVNQINEISTQPSLVWILLILLIIVFWIFNRYLQAVMINNKQFKGLIRLTWIAFLPWYIYSNPFRLTHKEQRFMIGGFVFILILVAHLVLMISELIRESMIQNQMKTEKNIIQVKARLEVVKPIAIIILTTLLLVQSTLGAQMYYHEEAFDDVNQALAYVGKQDDLTGVIMISDWFVTGGYTYLHRDVPIEFYTVMDPPRQRQNKIFIKLRLREGLLNYMIIPYYQLPGIDDIMEYALANHWILKQVEDTTEIWYLPT